MIGGGVAGLVAAWELARAGRAPIVLEASPAPGGTVARHTVDGLDLDAGAESFATATPAVAQLVSDLGLQDRVVSPNPAGAWVRHAAGAAPLPAGGLLGIPGRPLAADVRRVLGTPGALRAAVDRVLPRRTGTGPGTLGDLVRTRMGRRALDRLVAPVAGGVYSADPDGLETHSLNPRLLPALAEHGSLAAAVRALRGGAGARAGSAVAGLRGGMYSLVEALSAQIAGAGGEIRTGTPALALSRAGTAWQVSVAGAQLLTDLVVLATDAGPAAALLGPASAVTLPTDTTDVVLVTLVVVGPDLRAAPRGTGLLVAADVPGIAAKALTHATAKWDWLAQAAGPDRHVLRLSYGRGDRTPDDGELPALAARDAAALMGVPLGTVHATALTRWSATVPRFGTGHRDTVRALRAGLPPGLLAVGAHLAGTGLGAVVADARAAVAPLIASPSSQS
ncbi:protoporphyrinogen oxidase [Nakamurella sp. YIM 132087]|uniref:Coproporphyrinogen III oxidase n=1 Tax=Nakamurella alba TaxID=2665158 RepID=A0A7K1FIR3_9ACTN|nr:protoporphyrinogen oxidase [Nakamurella alba]